MKTRQIAKTLDDLVLLREFIIRGARVPVLKAQFPHIPENPIREMYYSVHGEISKRGLTPYSSLTIIKYLDQILHANTFFSIYRSFGGNDIFNSVDALSLIMAYDQYMSINPEPDKALEFVTAWYIARDLRAKILYVKPCRECGIERLYTAKNSWLNCPFCKIATRGRGRAKRAVTAQNKISVQRPKRT